MARTLPCFKCGKDLKPVCPDDTDRNQPYDAVCFYTSGQYGSTVFDSFYGEKLEINICDECLIQGSRHVLYLEGAPKRELRQWVPNQPINDGEQPK